MKNFAAGSASVMGIATGAATEPAQNAAPEKPAAHAADSPGGAGRVALDILRTPTRDLRSGEPDARASLVRAVEVNQAIVEKREMVVVDVRAAEDYGQGHVPGAVSLPREQWQTAAGLSKEKVNVVYCYSHTCPLGGEACAQLAGAGYPVVEMDGGFEVWRMSQLEVEQ